VTFVLCGGRGRILRMVVVMCMIVVMIVVMIVRG